MKLLSLPRYSSRYASGRLRFEQFYPALRSAGFEVSSYPFFDERYDAYGKLAAASQVGGLVSGYVRRVKQLLLAGHYDLLWVQTEALPWALAACEQALLPSHTKIVVDFDDAWFHRYDMHNSSIVRWLYADKIPRLMRRSSLVIAGNDYIAHFAQSAGAQRVCVLPTVVSATQYRARLTYEPCGELTIGWIGSPSTTRHLVQLAPVISQLRQSSNVRMLAVGADADQLRGLPVEVRPWQLDREVQDLQEMDIGVMPLPDSPWERGKCGFKLIQYMACGLPVVASPVGVNTSIVQAGVNGFLANSTAEWVASLERLISDPMLRQSMGTSGRQVFEKRYSYESAANNLVELIRSVVIRSADGGTE
jgi:glycosyltransferase involved in cell wall biosynthesis